MKNKGIERIFTSTITERIVMEKENRAMKNKEIKNALLKDMEMLRDGTWHPDSIESHSQLIKKLYKNTKEPNK